MGNEMTIRFTLAEKWQDKWFRQLKPIEKLLFLYICDNCNIAGIWEIDLEQAAFSIGSELGVIQGAYKGLTRGYEQLNETHIWVKNFLKHQRNLPLNPNNAAHAAIINLLLPYKSLSENILQLLSTEDIKGLTRGLQSPLSISISKGKGKSRSKGNGKTMSIFNESRKLFGGIKRGNQIEFDNFCKKHKDWENILPLLKPAVEAQIKWRQEANGEFQPPWKNFQTWINQSCWSEETPNTKPAAKTTSQLIAETEEQEQKRAIERAKEDLLDANH